MDSAFATREEAQEYLGSISRATLYRYVNAGVIETVRLGRRILIPWASLRDFKAQRQAVAQPDAGAREIVVPVPEMGEGATITLTIRVNRKGGMPALRVV